MKQLIEQFVRVAMLVALFCIAGCGGPAPDEVAEKCIDYLEEADFAGMREFATGGMVRWLDRAEAKYAEVAQLLGEKTAKKMKNTYDDLKYECGDATVDGDKATVQIKINGQSTPMTLIKVDGKWRIEKFNFPII